jgi:hypothetical protein
VKKIRGKQADYVLAVKENQPILYREIKEYFEYLDERQTKELPEEFVGLQQKTAWVLRGSPISGGNGLNLPIPPPVSLRYPEKDRPLPPPSENNLFTS